MTTGFQGHIERSPCRIFGTLLKSCLLYTSYTGDSHWVTGEESRKKVQEMRSVLMGIMVGSGTVKADDPLLN